jgi:hypothetical protein
MVSKMGPLAKCSKLQDNKNFSTNAIITASGAIVE